MTLKIFESGENMRDISLDFLLSNALITSPNADIESSLMNLFLLFKFFKKIVKIFVLN